MAKKIPFNVVFATSEDPNFPSSELNTHGPAVQGWRSLTHGNDATNDIILRFQKPAKVCRIQVLAHQYLIPQKIELWLHYSPKSIPSTPSGQSFDYLGFIALSDNATTNYKSRELQSVTVAPRNGTHLKLRLGEPHENEYNKSGQVSLIAVNILGDEIDNKDNIPDEANPSDEITVPEGAENMFASMCDDLLFSMYVEEGIAEIIREMEQMKAKAVSAERFEYARKLKLCMMALRNAGERMGRYSLAKRQAVQQEDFTTAKLRKEQIDIYRDSVLKHLEVEKLLERNGVLSENDESSDLYASKPTLPAPPILQTVASLLSEALLASSLGPKGSQNGKASADGGSSSHTTDTQPSSLPPKRYYDEIPNSPQLSRIGRSPSRGSPISNQGSLRRRNKSAPKNSYEDYEERAIPTLRHSHTNEFLRECQGTALLENDPNRGRSRLNDRERRQAALPILIFGIDLVEQFYSRQFQDREDGLIRLRNFLKGQDGEISGGANKIARSATLLLHRAVRDAVYSVFNQATETVRALFSEFVPTRVTPSEVARCVDRLLPELLAKSGDPSARIHTLAQHTILSIASCPEVKEQHLIAPALSRSVGSSTHPRLALSRMQMLEQLVLSQGIGTDKQSGLTCRALTECGCSGLHHPAEPVRKVAERVLLLVYKVNPRLVRKQLPPDDDITRRNLLYRQLFTEFDKLDLQRKKEMLDSNTEYTGHSSFGSPNANRTEKQSLSPNELKLKHNRTNFGFQSKTHDSQSSPMRRSENRVLKSKSGSTINNAENGSSQGSCNGKQELNEKIKQTINFQESRKSSNSNSESLEEQEAIRCSFCGWSGPGDQVSLDKHYWKQCPFLTKCPQCSQVLEVAALNYHLTNECEAKANYKCCERCTESVHKSLYELHKMEDYCRELKTGAARCPLCHDDVHLPLDGGWKLHLLSSSGCPGNARRKKLKTGAARCPLCHDDVHLPLDGGWKLHLLSSSGCPGNARRKKLKTGAARCPLCHDDVHLPLDGGWKLHLLSSSGCPGNARRKSKV